MTRAKSSLPLTRFVAPKRLVGSNDQKPESKTPTPSLTPVEEEETIKGTDESVENEEVEHVVTNTDRNKKMDTSGSMVEAALEITTIPDESLDPATILEAVQALQQDFIKHQENFDEFVSEANARIIKLEKSISTQTTEDENKCREGIQELKDLMANIHKHSPSSTATRYESALSFNDFDNQRSRTRSHLSRFTQLDSEDESFTPATIDPSLLQLTKPLRNGQSPTTSPDSSSQPQPSSPPEDQEGNPQDDQQEAIREISGSGPPEMMDLNDLEEPDIPSSPPTASPPRSSPSVFAAAARLMSLAEAQFVGSSSPVSPPQAAGLETSETPTQATQPVEATQATDVSTQLTLPPPSPLPTPTNPPTHSTSKTTKRPRRSATLPIHAIAPPEPPPKKQKSNKSIKKPPTTKKKSTGPQGSLPVGTLKKSKGVTRVKGARWPPSGPNTVIGLGGFIECESCLGPVHRSCAGLMDEEEIPNLSWVCPDCDHVEENGGPKLPVVENTEACVRPTCIRRLHKKIVWKPSDVELYIIKQAIGRRPLQPARSFSKGKFEYLTEWIGYPLNESTWEPIESFVAADEMATQFVVAAEGQGWDLEEMGDGVVLLEEAMAAFGADGELRVS